MNLRRKLTDTLILQMIGAVASFAANIIIARHYGPAGQGYLSYLRSISDLLVSIGLFGFPQAFVYMINAQIASVHWSVRFSFYHTALFGLLLLVGTLVVHLIGLTTTNGLDLLAAIAISLATIGALLHGLYRAIILAVKSNRLFNLISILPLVALCLIYLIWQPADSRVLIWAYVAAQVLASLGAVYLLRDLFLFRLPISQHDNRAWIQMAARYGLWSFVATILANFLNVSAFSVLREGGISDAAVGYFSISLLFLSASLIPLNMIIPVLFDSWSKEKELSIVQHTYVKLSHVGLLLSVVALGAGFLLTRIVTEVVFGSTYLPSVVSTQILLFSIYALYQNRLLSAILLSKGKPHIVASGAVLKLLSLGLIWFGMSDSLDRIAWAWNIGEFASMGLMICAVRLQTGWSFTYLLGFSPSWLVTNLKTMVLSFQ